MTHENDPVAAVAHGMAPDSDFLLDHDRHRRRGGFPEAVYCEGKSADQVRRIARSLRQHAAIDQTDSAGTGDTRDTLDTFTATGHITLFTRAGAEHAQAVLDELPDAMYDPQARMLAWPATPPPVSGGLVVVAAAGSSDLPVAREAELTARYLGRPTELVIDVGVAGLHRILGRLDLLRQARAIVCVAGMDGALPSVVGGLVSAPVVAVPTSVGYGAAFGGIAALLTMLNACAPGVVVVNIDNGYGAGHAAAQIAAPTR